MSKEYQEDQVETALDFRENLGIEFLETTEGFAQSRMKVHKSHMNVHGIIHGGCLFTLADTTSGRAVVTYGHSVTTVTSSISYLRSGKDTDYLTARASVIKHGQTFSTCDAEIYDDKQVLLAKTTMTFYHLV